MSKMPILQICLTKSGYGAYFHFWLLLLIVNTLIDGFADKKTETFCQEGRVAAFSGFARIASRKLDQLDAATDLRDLSRPGNRLKALKGRRKGQWRICFEWPEGNSGPTDVEIVDYH